MDNINVNATVDTALSSTRGFVLSGKYEIDIPLTAEEELKELLNNYASGEFNKSLLLVALVNAAFEGVQTEAGKAGFAELLESIRSKGVIGRAIAA